MEEEDNWSRRGELIPERYGDSSPRKKSPALTTGTLVQHSYPQRDPKISEQLHVPLSDPTTEEDGRFLTAGRIQSWSSSSVRKTLVSSWHGEAFIARSTFSFTPSRGRSQALIERLGLLTQRRERDGWYGQGGVMG